LVSGCARRTGFFKVCQTTKPLLLAENTALRDTVCRLLREDWSPEQISERLRESQLAGEPKMSLSHETICKSPFIQARGVICEELKKHLRKKRMLRRARVHRVSSREQIADLLSIRERPAEIEDRAVPIHWEGGLIIGVNNSAIATVVERQSRFTVLCRVKNRKASSVVSALTDQMLRLPQHLLKNLIWDRE
jgi:IS30 family transposase